LWASLVEADFEDAGSAKQNRAKRKKPFLLVLRKKDRQQTKRNREREKKRRRERETGRDG
jgi:hypothetical protein